MARTPPPTETPAPNFVPTIIINTNNTPKTLDQMTFYAQGMADALQRKIYILGTETHFRASDEEPIDKSKILKTLIPNKEKTITP